MVLSETARAASRIAPNVEARPQADPAITLQESKALRTTLRELPRRDFDAECADLFTDAMTTVTRYSLLDATGNALSAGRYTCGEAGDDGSRDCAERADHEEIW